MDIEKEFLYEKTKESTENAIEIMLYFFVFFDIGIIVYSNFKFKSKNESVKTLIDILLPKTHCQTLVSCSHQESRPSTLSGR